MKTYSLFVFRLLLVALLIACSACRSVKHVDASAKFVAENPGYSLTRVPLLAAKREAFYMYQQPAINIALLKRAAETLSKDELLERLGRQEQFYLKCYEGAKKEITEIEKHLSKGGVVYWYTYKGPDFETEGYIIIDAAGKILMEPII